jgi:hypothetical protein
VRKRQRSRSRTAMDLHGPSGGSNLLKPRHVC